MSLSDIASLVSLVLSSAAIGISGFLSIRQIRVMRQANQLPAVVELLQEYRSDGFVEHQDYILNKLSRHDPSGGYSGLNFEARRHFLPVFDYLSSMACLVAFRVVSVEHIFALYGFLIPRLWRAMLPYVEEERRLTGNDVGFIIQGLVSHLESTTSREVAQQLRITDSLY
jgi:hypothetical protein